VHGWLLDQAEVWVDEADQKHRLPDLTLEHRQSLIAFVWVVLARELLWDLEEEDRFAALHGRVLREVESSLLVRELRRITRPSPAVDGWRAGGPVAPHP
jgi:hypothetical protein